jgi:PAS domain S-box-containing protein
MPLPVADRRPSRLAGLGPLLLAGLVFLAALVVTTALWQSARQAANVELEATFSYRARDLAARIDRRMAVYEQVLRGAQGFLRGSVDISQKDFATYFKLLKLDEHFPGIEALGIATIIPRAGLARHEARMRAEGFPDYQVHPRDEREVYSSITHIEPFGGRNLRAFGFDMFSEPVRRQAMEQARDTGRAAATGKVVLVQEGGQHSQFGFLTYLPVYRGGMPPPTVQARRAAVVGWVYAPFRMNDLMRGLGGEHSADLDVTIYDGGKENPDAILFQSTGGEARSSHQPMFTRVMPAMASGRPWLLVIGSAPSLEATLGHARPRAVLLMGAGLGFLLAVVVWLLASERRRALQLAERMTHALRLSRDRVEAEQQRMKVILQNTYEAFIAVDHHGRITDWNAQAAALFGWSEQEAIGKDVGELIVPPDQRQRHHEGFARFSQSGEGALLHGQTELMAQHRDGHLIPVELALAPLRTPAGFGATAFVRDITPRKQAELRERQRQQRLDEARAALQRSQKLEAVGKLTGGVAHDFNNILHIISANVQLMLKSGDPSRKRLLSTLDAVERGTRLVAQLLAFARRQPLHPSVVNVARLLERMDTLLHRAAGAAVRIRLASPGELWNTLVDPNQLENVLINLVINARDAMDGKGSVTIRLDNVELDGEPATDPGIPPGQYVLIAVADTGAGMPAEVMERAFEPFFTTKPEGKGTGLGLSMAHGFVKQSGGHIRLASTPGEGTTVSIYLPRCTSGVSDAAAAPSIAAPG